LTSIAQSEMLMYCCRWNVFDRIKKVFYVFRVDECLQHYVFSILDITKCKCLFFFTFQCHQETQLWIKTSETFFGSKLLNLWMLISLTCNSPCLSSLWKNKQPRLWLNHLIQIYNHKLIVGDNYQKFIIMSTFNWIYG